MNETTERLSLEQIQGFFDNSPFIATLGLEALSLDYEAMEFTVRMPMNPGLERRAGSKQFHGGPIASFVDVAGDYAIGMLLGGGVPTVNFRIDFLKPAVGDALVAVARVRRMGRTVAVVDIDVFNEQDALVAMARGTYVPKIG